MNKIKLLTGLGCLSLSGVASAALISPSGGDGAFSLGVGNPGTVTLDTGTWGTGHTIDNTGLNLADGAELTATTTHQRSNSGNSGRSLGTGGAGFTSFILDLGGSFNLDQVVLWNGGEDDRRSVDDAPGRSLADRDQTDRGISSAEFFFTTDGVGSNDTDTTTWVSLGTFNFDRTAFDETVIGTTDFGVNEISAQVRDFSQLAAGATHIRFDATNFGDGNIVSFSEIAFNEVAVVPEPSSALLGALGLGLMVVRRKR